MVVIISIHAVNIYNKSGTFLDLSFTFQSHTICVKLSERSPEKFIFVD